MKLKKAYIPVSPVVNYVLHIYVSIAYRLVKNDDDVCEKIVSLILQRKG